MPLVADQTGTIHGSFTIPPNLPAGTKPVEAYGAGGLPPAKTTYTGNGVITTDVFQRTLLTTIWRESDPLAQPFMLPTSRQITSVDVQFCAFGDKTKKVALQVRDVQLGVPTTTTFGEGVLDVSNVALNTWVNIPLKAPTFIQDHVLKALVFMTDDGYHALSVAELGKFDAVHQRWVTANPYTVAPVLASQNQQTWTALQGTALLFRLKAALYTQTQLVVDCGNVQLTNCTDLMVQAGVDLPSSDTRAVVKITRADNSVIVTDIGAPIQFSSRITEQVNIKILMSGTSTLSPILYPVVQVWMGNQVDTANYISRAVPAGTDCRIDLTLECLTPGSSSIVIDLGQDPISLNSGGYQTGIAIANALPVGDGWQERTYTVRHYQLSDARNRITLSGSPAARPQIRNLRMAVTADPVNNTG